MAGRRPQDQQLSARVAACNRSSGFLNTLHALCRPPIHAKIRNRIGENGKGKKKRAKKQNVYIA